LIFYVSEKRPELLDAVCDKLYLAVTQIQDSHIRNLIVGNVSAFIHATRLVIDLSSVRDTTNEIIEAIKAFRSVNDRARVIVIADSEPSGSRLINRLFNIGIYNILVDINEESLKKCLTTGYTRDEAEALCLPLGAPEDEIPVHPAPAEEKHPQPAPAAREIITANKDYKKRKPYITVAICSAEAHMGATHQALLMAKFLSSAGFKVCYLEANKRRKIVSLAKRYPINANEQMRLIQFEGIDMYFDINIHQIIDMGYDFYIFDLGRLEEMDAQAFTSKDMRFVVGGTKTWEMPSYDTVLNTPGAERSFSFIMNFTPPREMASIKKMMGEFKLYFSEYVPYPFENNVNIRIYKEMFKQYLTVTRSRSNVDARD